jgi:glycerol-3-phosphate acyltransferase PlsY
VALASRLASPHGFRKPPCIAAWLSQAALHRREAFTSRYEPLRRGPRVSVFAPTLLMGFAATMFLAGLFGAYYGKGRSRSMGILLSLAAVLLLGVLAALTWPLVQAVTPIFQPQAVTDAAVAVAAAFLGSLAAVALFVFAVMRS